MSSILNRYERQEKAWSYASEIIRQVTGGTKEDHQYRLATDRFYYEVVHLITDMFLEIEKNHDFKNELNNTINKLRLKSELDLKLY